MKAETNLRAKVLKTYQEKFTPEIAVRTSMADFKKEDRLVNFPLYAVEQIAELLLVIYRTAAAIRKPGNVPSV